MLLERFEHIDTFFPPCHPGEAEWIAARARLMEDISSVFPYLNTRMKGAVLDKNHNTLNFKFGGRGVTLHARLMVVTRLHDRKEAIKVLGELKNLINQTYEHRDRIQPSERSRRILTVLEIYRLLPRKNCGECGEPACMGFVAKLLEESRKIESCRPLFLDEHAASRKKLLQLLDEAGYLVPEN
jgi:ArsR family metal-binding transcriptional regulator